MRRSLIALTVFASIGLLACEDGPNQPFSPAPANAGDRWNDGRRTPRSIPATQGFEVDAGGNNKQLICTGAELAARWAVMVKAAHQAAAFRRRARSGRRRLLAGPPHSGRREDQLPEHERRR